MTSVSKKQSQKTLASQKTQNSTASQQQQQHDKDQFMKTFFDQVQLIENGMAELTTNMPVISRLHDQILNAYQEHEERKYHKQLTALTDQCSSSAYSLNAMIKALEEGIDVYLSPNSADHRMCFTQHVSLSRKLRTLITQYQTLQKSYREKQKLRFQRQYRIINPQASEQEISALLESEHRGPIFAESILSAQLRDDSTRVLNDVKYRHREIVDLSKKIVQLDQLFTELDSMVVQQDDIVNQVAYMADNAQAYLQESNVQLANAVKSAKSRRRRRWCLAVSCMILLGTVAAVIVIVVVPKIKEMAK